MRALIRLHRWTGLTAGVLAAFMAATGIGLALRPSVEPLLQRQLLSVARCDQPLPLDRLAQAAREAHPGGRIASLWVYGAPDRSMLIRFADNDTLYLDPCTGEILGRLQRYGGIFGAIERLHKWAYGENDQPLDVVPGSCALALAVLLAGFGLYIGWPRKRRAWRSALTIDRRLRGPAARRNLHLVAGIYSCLVILASAVTGVPQAFDWAQHAILAVTGSPPPAPPRPPVGEEGAFTLDKALAEARGAVSDAALTVMRFSAKPAAPVEIYMVATDAPHANARSYLYLDRRSGAVLGFRPYAAAGSGQKLLFWATALHTGQVGGLAGRIVMTGGMLAVLFLFYTGVSSAIHRSSRRPVVADLEILEPPPMRARSRGLKSRH